jgi:hypothetical protein
MTRTFFTDLDFLSSLKMKKTLTRIELRRKALDMSQPEEPQVKRKLVLNRCFGGRSWSPEAKALLKAGKSDVEIVELLGASASGGSSGTKLELVEIPAELEPLVQVREYDGWEWIEYDLTDWLADQVESLDASNVDEFRGKVKRLLALIAAENDREHTGRPT